MCSETSHCGLNAEKRAQYALVTSLLNSGRKMNLHALGITGIGLSGVSYLFHSLGWSVTGCDTTPSIGIERWLSENGIAISHGHSPTHIAAGLFDLVLRTPAVPDVNPEIEAAHARGIPVVCRGAALAAISAARRTVAVCGAHGKTTTSCFTAHVLEKIGAEPSWCIGGYADGMTGVAHCGANNGPLVVEADESDGTLALYNPCVTVVTSVDADHLEHFANFDELCACYREALLHTSHGIAFCADDATAPNVVRDALAERTEIPSLGYGFSPTAQVKADDVKLDANSSTFSIVYNGTTLGRTRINVPGRHNILNALGAFSAAVLLGFAPETVFTTISTLDALPKRRFEETEIGDSITAVSDYSHHPAEIRALVQTALIRKPNRVVAVFQPHRYTRTKALGPYFPNAFKGVDVLALLPVYAASEPPLQGGRTEDLYREFRKTSGDTAGIPIPLLLDGVDAAVQWLRRILKHDDTLLVIGAGNVVEVFDRICTEYRLPLTDKLIQDGLGLELKAEIGRETSFGTGGTADIAFKVSTDGELAEVLKLAREAELPVRVMGGGTNLLVNDAGARGITLVLGGEDYDTIVTNVNEGTVLVGAGVIGAYLLNKLRDRGLSGLEFMSGVPGTVGGWLAMNAGTRNGCFGERVESFTAYSLDGQRHEITADAAGFGYRKCTALEDKIAISVKLRLKHDFPGLIKNRMDAARQIRFNFAGLHTAGSVFRNPPGASAGKLLDEAGCKGLRVGGAYVCERHANIIAVDTGATSADVIALSQLMHDKVLEQFNIDLQREIRIW